MKFLITLCLFATLAGAAWSGNASWGRRQPQDFLLYRKLSVFLPIYGNYQSVNVVYPPQGQHNLKNITFINVIDNFRNNSGGQASLWSGGPGFRFATINLKSRIGFGINMTTEIFGK